MHSIEINTRNAEITATMGTHRDQNGIESLLAQIRDHEVAACGVIQLERDVARLENFAHLGFHYVTGQTVFRNAEIQHAAGNRRRFKNGYGIAH